MKIPKEIEAALIATGRPWSTKMGGRHVKLILDGRMVGVLPINGGNSASHRGSLNVISQIRRAARSQVTSASR